MRILVVDDSAVVRNVVRKALETCEPVHGIDVAATAKIARDKIDATHFDLIFCDINLPIQSGPEFVVELKKSNISIPVVFFSALHPSEISVVLRSLELGAFDYVQKPSIGNGEEAGVEGVRKLLKPFLEIKSYAPTDIRQNFEAKIINSIECMVIGASTGGPLAVQTFFSDFKVSGIPILLSIHMPKVFVKGYAERLNGLSHFPVKIAEEGMILQKGTCYISNGGQSLSLKKEGEQVILHYNNNAGPGGIYPSVDELFSSAAKIFKRHTLGVVLTGMGSDGFIGSTEIKKQGGVVLIQDQKSSTVFGMPGRVYQSGLYDGIYDIAQIGMQLTEQLNEFGRIKRYVS